MTSLSVLMREAIDKGDDKFVLLRLSDLPSLEEACRASISELLSTFAYVLRQALRPLPPEAQRQHSSGALIDRVTLSLIETTLDQAQGELKKKPELLFPTLYNQLYWYDAPERSDHKMPPRKPPSRNIYRLMEHWREAFEARPSSYWLRSVRPPASLAADLPSFRVQGDMPVISPRGGFFLIDKSRFHQGTEAHSLVNGRTLGALLAKGESYARDGSLVSSLAARGVVFSVDGSLLLAKMKTHVELFSVGEGSSFTPLKSFGSYDTTLQGALHFLALSLDSAFVLTASFHKVIAWRVEDGAEVASLTVTGSMRAIIPMRDGRALLLTHGGFLLWDYTQGRVLFSREQGGSHDPAYLALSPNEERVITITKKVGVDSTVLEGFSLPKGEALFHHVVGKAHGDLVFHPSGAFFAMGSAFFDPDTGQKVQSVPGINGDLSFDPSGRFFASAGTSGVVLWDIPSKSIYATLSLKARYPVFSKDGRFLLLSEGDSTLVFDLSLVSPNAPLVDDARPVKRWLRLSPSGDTLVTDYEGGLHFWDIRRGAIFRSVQAQMLNHAFHFLDNNRMVVGLQGEALLAWDTHSGEELFSLSLPEERWKNLTKAPDASLFLTDTQKGAIIAWALTDGKERYRLSGATLFAGHGRLLRRASGSLHLHELERGTALCKLPSIAASHFCISPNQKWLAVYGFADGRVIELWDLSSGVRMRQVSTPESGDEINVTSVWFSDDSATMLATIKETTGLDERDRFYENHWDVASGAILKDITGPELHTWMSWPTKTALPGGLLFQNEEGISLHGKMLIETPHIEDCFLRVDKVYLAQRYGRLRLYELRYPRSN